MPETERLTDFLQSMPKGLQQLLNTATGISKVRADTQELSIKVIDHTSLSDQANAPMIGSETASDIQSLCLAAKGQTAAVCVYPNHIETAVSALQSCDVQIAVVNNFPHGDDTVSNAQLSALMAISSGADEIDTVLDYVSFLDDDEQKCVDKLMAVSAVCMDNNVALKTILKASAYTDYRSLYSAAKLACDCGADFVKTCTGKTAKDGYGDGTPDASTLLTGATVMQAVADFNMENNTNIGVKISGGVKTALDCEQFRFLVDNILGPDYFSPDLFRFGASSLLGNLTSAIQQNDGY